MLFVSINEYLKATVLSALKKPSVYEVNTSTMLLFFFLKALTPEVTLTILILKPHTRKKAKEKTSIKLLATEKVCFLYQKRKKVFCLFPVP